MDDRCVFDLCVFVVKRTNRQLPNWLYNLTTVTEIRGTITRQSNDLLVSRTNTTAGTKMLIARGSLLWNKIPQEVRKKKTLISVLGNL